MITYRIPSLDIEIGDHPQVYNHEQSTLSKYDVIMNVSDEGPYGSLYEHRAIINWFPINEFGYWGYQPFFWAVRILDEATQNNRSVYLHCHAGMHRSPMTGYLYVRSLGKSSDEAFELVKDSYVQLGEKNNWLEETFQNDVEYGRIPADIIEFMKNVRTNPMSSLMSIMAKRNVLDLPQKTIEKNGVKKPVGEIQVIDFHSGLFKK